MVWPVSSFHSFEVFAETLQSLFLFGFRNHNLCKICFYGSLLCCLGAMPNWLKPNPKTFPENYILMIEMIWQWFMCRISCIKFGDSIIIVRCFLTTWETLYFSLVNLSLHCLCFCPLIISNSQHKQHQYKDHVSLGCIDFHSSMNWLLPCGRGYIRQAVMNGNEGNAVRRHWSAHRNYTANIQKSLLLNEIPVVWEKELTSQ